MHIPQLTEELWFPPPEAADEFGLLAFGGDTQPERLILAYSQGIFPWPSDDLPLLWFSPDPRFVLHLDNFKVNRSLRKTLKSDRYTTTFDRSFPAVVRNCQTALRPGQAGTWITNEMFQGYCALHELGFAHSVETYRGDELVGGLYGVSLGAAFFGESMFALESDASKVALASLVATLKSWQVEWIDCQMETDVFQRFGAQPVPRRQFLAQLREKLSFPTRHGPWSGIVSPRDAATIL